MKYTTLQLELIAIMFKIQHGEMTVGDFFPDIQKLNDSKLKIGELDIDLQPDGDIDFLSDGALILWFSFRNNRCRAWRSECTIPMDDIIKMLSFEDKV